MRITVDMDFPTEVEVLRAYNYLKTLGTPKARISSSGKGIHLKVHGYEPDSDKVERIRRLLGDDNKRVDIDRERKHKPKQVMFSSKHGDEATGWNTDVLAVVDEYKTQNPMLARGIL